MKAAVLIVNFLGIFSLIFGHSCYRCSYNSYPNTFPHENCSGGYLPDSYRIHCFASETQLYDIKLGRMLNETEAATVRQSPGMVFACLKTVSKSGEKERVTKACTQSPQGSDDFCKMVGEQGNRKELCVCHLDGCNGSSVLTVSVALIISCIIKNFL